VSDDSVYCFCTKFGQLIITKIIKTVATRCQILRLKCTKIKNSAGSAPDLAEELPELTALPRPLAVFKGPTSKGRGREGSGGYGRGLEGRAGEGRGGSVVESKKSLK